MNTLEYVIKLKNLSIEKQGYLVFDDISYYHAYAEFAYIIGETGSGKSSLLKSLYGQNTIVKGHAEVAGVALKEMKGDALAMFRRKLGMVFQEMHLFEAWSVEKNLDFVLMATDWTNKDLRDQRITAVLEKVGLQAKRNDKAGILSGGQRQKLAIARAILNKPSIILADEPTGHLDPKSSDELMHLFQEIARENETAILFTTHDHRIIDKFPARVFECLNKKLIER